MVSRSELATRLARNGASHAQAVHAVDAVLHEITAALVAGERVALTGFGTFEPVARSERTARNPRTGEPVQVPAATVARFRAGAGLRGALHSGDAGSAPEGALPPTGFGATAPAAGAGFAADTPQGAVTVRDEALPGGRATSTRSTAKHAEQTETGKHGKGARQAAAKASKAAEEDKAAVKQGKAAKGTKGSKAALRAGTQKVSAKAAKASTGGKGSKKKH